MKKIFLIAFILCSIQSIAQRNTPRFGSSGTSDNTYARLNLGTVELADTAGSTPDSLGIIPGSNSKVTGVYSNHYRLTLTDSCVLYVYSLKSSWLWDEITIDIENTSGSGHWVQFLGASPAYSGTTSWGMASTGTKISLASAKSATLTFYCNGFIWNEKSRVIR